MKTKQLDLRSGSPCDVIYVDKKDAKTVKLRLESEGFLNKDFRIAPAKEFDIQNHHLYVSIPVSSSFNEWINKYSDTDRPEWYSSFVMSHGKTNVPFSTRILGRR